MVNYTNSILYLQESKILNIRKTLIAPITLLNSFKLLKNQVYLLKVNTGQNIVKFRCSDQFFLSIIEGCFSYRIKRNLAKTSQSDSI